ncbi:MAG: pyridine nucleotide-disulfide oxidoreductase, partial [Gemmatimonadetes bacterium]
MPDYTYLIVGGGMTADAAAQALHAADPKGSIGVIGAEPHPPYDRPPLSKALWKGEPEDKIWRKTAATGATLHLGRRVSAIDPRGRKATDDQGTVYRFQKLLLATGGTPRRLSTDADQII